MHISARMRKRPMSVWHNTAGRAALYGPKQIAKGIYAQKVKHWPKREMYMGVVPQKTSAALGSGITVSAQVRTEDLSENATAGNTDTFICTPDKLGETQKQLSSS